MLKKKITNLVVLSVFVYFLIGCKPDPANEKEFAKVDNTIVTTVVLSEPHWGKFKSLLIANPLRTQEGGTTFRFTSNGKIVTSQTSQDPIGEWSFDEAKSLLRLEIHGFGPPFEARSFLVYCDEGISCNVVFASDDIYHNPDPNDRTAMERYRNFIILNRQSNRELSNLLESLPD